MVTTMSDQNITSSTDWTRTDPFGDLDKHQDLMVEMDKVLQDAYDTNELSREILADLDQHKNDPNAHHIPRHIESAVITAQEYTRTKVAEHNEDPRAHQDIRANIAAVDADLQAYKEADTDENVETTPSGTTKAYVTGTVSSDNTIGKLIIDRQV